MVDVDAHQFEFDHQQQPDKGHAKAPQFEELLNSSASFGENLVAIYRVLSALDTFDLNRQLSTIPDAPPNDAPKQVHYRWLRESSRACLTILKSWGAAVGKSDSEMNEFFDTMEHQINDIAMFGHSGPVGPAAGGTPGIVHLAERQKKMAFMLCKELIETQSKNPWDDFGNPVGTAHAAVYMAEQIGEDAVEERRKIGAAIVTPEVVAQAKKLAECFAACAKMATAAPGSELPTTDAKITTVDRVFKNESDYNAQLRLLAYDFAHWILHNANCGVKKSALGDLSEILEIALIKSLLSLAQDKVENFFYLWIEALPKIQIGSRQFKAIIGGRLSAVPELQVLIRRLVALQRVDRPADNYASAICTYAKPYILDPKIERPRETEDEAEPASPRRGKSPVRRGRTAADAAAPGSEKDDDNGLRENAMLIAHSRVIVPMRQAERTAYDGPADIEEYAVRSTLDSIADLLRLHNAEAESLTDVGRANQESLRNRVTSSVLDTFLLIAGAGASMKAVQAVFGYSAAYKEFDNAAKVMENQQALLKRLDGTTMRSMLGKVSESKSLKELAQTSMGVRNMRKFLFKPDNVTSVDAWNDAIEPLDGLMSSQTHVLYNGFDEHIKNYYKLSKQLANESGRAAEVRDVLMKEMRSIFDTIYLMRDLTKQVNAGASAAISSASAEIKWFRERIIVLSDFLDDATRRLDDSYRAGVMEQVNLVLAVNAEQADMRHLIVDGLTDAIVVVKDTIHNSYDGAAALCDGLFGVRGTTSTPVMLIEAVLRPYIKPLDTMRITRMLQSLRAAQIKLLDMSTVKNAMKSLAPGIDIVVKEALQNSTVILGAPSATNLTMQLFDDTPGTDFLTRSETITGYLSATTLDMADENSIVKLTSKALAQLEQWISGGLFEVKRNMKITYVFGETNNAQVDITAQVQSVTGLRTTLVNTWANDIGEQAASRTIDLVTDPRFEATPSNLPAVQLVASQVFSSVRALVMALFSFGSAARRTLFARTNVAYPTLELSRMIARREAIIVKLADTLDQRQIALRQLDALDVYFAYHFENAPAAAQDAIKQAVISSLDRNPTDRFGATARAMNIHLQHSDRHFASISQATMYRLIKDRCFSPGTYISDTLTTYSMMTSMWSAFAFLAPAVFAFDFLAPYGLKGTLSPEFTSLITASGTMVGCALGLGVVPAFDAVVNLALDHAIHKDGYEKSLTADEANRVAVVRMAVRNRRRLSLIDSVAQSLSDMGPSVARLGAFSLCKSMMLAQPTHAHELIAFLFTTIAFDGLGEALYMIGKIPYAKAFSKWTGWTGFVINTLVSIPVVLTPVISFGQAAMGYISYSPLPLGWIARFAGKLFMASYIKDAVIGVENYSSAVAFMRTLAAVFSTLVVSGKLWTTIRYWTAYENRKSLRRLQYEDRNANAAPPARNVRNRNIAPAPLGVNSDPLNATLRLAEMSDVENWALESTSLRSESIIGLHSAWFAGFLALVGKLAIPLFLLFTYFVLSRR